MKANISRYPIGTKFEYSNSLCEIINNDDKIMVKMIDLSTTKEQFISIESFNQLIDLKNIELNI